MARLAKMLFFVWMAVLVAASPAQAQTFPKLTGRVVDQAELLTPAQEAELSAKCHWITKSSRPSGPVAPPR